MNFCCQIKRTWKFFGSALNNSHSLCLLWNLLGNTEFSFSSSSQNNSFNFLFLSYLQNRSSRFLSLTFHISPMFFLAFLTSFLLFSIFKVAAFASRNYVFGSFVHCCRVVPIVLLFLYSSAFVSFPAFLFL